MRRLWTLILLLVAASASAQTARRPALATADVVIHRIDGASALGDSTGLGQVSVPLYLFAPVLPGVDVSVRASYASTFGDTLATVAGITDAQLGLSVRRPVQSGEVAVGLGVTVPTSGEGLSRAEAGTTFLAAQPFFDLAVPTLQRGPGLTPSVSAAFPVGARVVVGVGGAVHLRGAFEPRGGLDTTSFDPADELLLTVGLDALLPGGAAVALDASYVRYGTDTFGDLEYGTGDAFGVSAQWTGAVAGLPATVAGAYRQKAESTLDATAAGALLGRDAAIPTQARLRGTLRADLSARASVGLSAGARYYADSEAFEGLSLLDVAVEPAARVAEDVFLVGTLGGTVGSFTAVRVGAGVRWSLLSGVRVAVGPSLSS